MIDTVFTLDAAATPASAGASVTGKPSATSRATAKPKARASAAARASASAKTATVAGTVRKASPAAAGRLSAGKPATAAKKPAARPAKVPAVPSIKPSKGKHKLVRDSFTMPQSDFDLVDVLKQRAMNFRHAVKKGELLRAGLQVLAALPDVQLQIALARITPLKTGRPKKAD